MNLYTMMLVGLIVVYINGKPIHHTHTTIKVISNETRGNPYINEHLHLKNSKNKTYVKRDTTHQQQQQAGQRPQSFIELILGIIDTLQFGKRKIGSPS